MFQAEQQAIEQGIRAYCAQHELPAPEALVWSPIPFSGEWGISTSFFQFAAQEARSLKASGQNPGAPVPLRAQEIAAALAAHLGTPAGFSRVEAVKGYLNLLMKNGLIECEVASPRLYRSTSKGLETMNRLKELHRELEQLINNIPGVVTVGLFALRGADVLILGTAAGARRLEPV